MAQQIGAAEWQEKVVDSPKPVLIDFFATWCGPCKAMAPLIDEIAAENADSIDVYKVDIDEDMELAMKYKILSVPTFMVFKDGKEAARKVGTQSKDQFLEMLA